MPIADLEAKARAGDVRAQVQWAMKVDAQGGHYEALEWLARAAATHDPQALSVLGAKLLFAENAPYRPRDGLGMLVEAAGGGDASAAATLSVLAAGGFHTPQSWNTALHYLERAAELGWAPAREQLDLLSFGAGGGVDLDGWLSPPPARPLCESPRIFTVEALAPSAVCDWIVGQSAGRLVRAEVDDPRTGLPVMGQTRTNRVASFGLADTSVLHLLIQHRIGAAAGAPLAMMEAFAVLNYRPGEEASGHFDFLDPAVPAYAQEIARVGQRIATALLYLNDDYSGGTTDFPELGLEHRGTKGDALIFFSVDQAGAPDRRTLHAGRPPMAGEKWVLSQFIRNRAMAPAGGQ